MDRSFLHLLVLAAFPLLLPSTYSIPSHAELHGIQPPLNSPPTAPGTEVSLAKGHELSASRPTLAEKVAAEIVADSPHVIGPRHDDYRYVSTERSSIGEEHHILPREEDDHEDDSAGERGKEVQSFLEEEGERGWGLDDPSPRPPYFLQSSELGELYEAEGENDDLHASDGIPWFPPIIPRAVTDSPHHPILLPSHEPSPASEDPWPSVESIPVGSSASPSHAEDISSGEGSGVRGPRDQSQQLASKSQFDSTPSPEANPNPEKVTSSLPLWNLFSSPPPPSYIVSSPPSSSPPPSHFNYDPSSPAPSIPESSTPSPVQPEATLPPSPSAFPDAPPPSPSPPIPSDPPSADAARGREGKAIGIGHMDQQPKQEEKHAEGVAIGDLAGSTTVMPTKLDVDSSPEKSSSSLNASILVREEDEADLGTASVDPKDAVLADSSNLNDNEKRDSKEESSEVKDSLSVIEEDAGKVDEPKVVIGPKLEKDIDSTNDDSSGPRESVSGQGKPMQEDDVSSPVEVPTAVAVREGGTSAEKSRPEEKNMGGDEMEPPNDKVGKESATTVVNVQSSVQQGRMTAPKALDAASIVGISLGSVLLVGAVAGGVGFVLYRRSLYANKPQTLNDKCSNPDSSGYIDDTLRVSSGCPPQRMPRPMPRSGTELTRGCSQGRRGGGRGGGVGEGGRPQQPGGAKENSEEMYSLDNDSFLNSLEAMTIQNYWTDSVKHTKL
ncbi:uncharacterized protein [Hetaerina americana]|uniref:uncharacterized protein isoform X2 n=1 Tax=Hetaerina americana TaxID=62018 RepID=UPI003A7F581B